VSELRLAGQNVSHVRQRRLPLFVVRAFLDELNVFVATISRLASQDREGRDRQAPHSGEYADRQLCELGSLGFVPLETRLRQSSCRRRTRMALPPTRVLR